jgi:hypothetical protein
MKPETKKFLESLNESKQFTYDVERFFPYLGSINLSEASPFDLLQMVYHKGVEDGICSGKREKIMEIKKALLIYDED